MISKHQIKPKLQAPRIELLSDWCAGWRLGFNVLLVFDIWCLVFSPPT